MMIHIDKMIALSFKVLKAVLLILLISMVGILVAHIWCRYVLNNSLTWSEELMKIMLVWFGMLSVAVLAVRREHVAIVVFKERMPKKVSDFLSKFTQALIVVICIVVVVVGFKYMISSGSRLTPALRIPYAWAYAAIPVSFLLVSFYELRNFIVDITGKGQYAAVEKPVEDLSGGAGMSEF